MGILHHKIIAETRNQGFLVYGFHWRTLVCHLYILTKLWKLKRRIAS